MTIAVAVSVSEGLVLAADSRTTHWVSAGDTRWPEVATDRARKVFPLSDRTGAATYGRSQIARHTVAAAAERFRWDRPRGAADDVESVMEAFTRFLRESLGEDTSSGGEAPPEAHVGFLLAGYSQDGTGKLYELRFPEGSSHLLSTTDSPNYHWRGHGDAVSRLMKGIDPHFDRSALPPDVAERIPSLEYAVRLRHMSLEDAVDFARFLAEVARGVDRFVSGTLASSPRYQLIGGPLSVAVVTREGFAWVAPPAIGAPPSAVRSGGSGGIRSPE